MMSMHRQPNNVNFVLTMCWFSVYLACLFCVTVVLEIEWRARIVGDNAHVKGQGRRHANLNLSISGTVPRGTMIIFSFLL